MAVENLPSSAGVRSLIKTFGSSSVVVLGGTVNSCLSKLGKFLLAGSTVSWSERVNHPQHILAKESKVAFCFNLTPSQSLYLRVVPFCNSCSQHQQDQCTLYSFIDTDRVCSCKLLSSFFPCKTPRKQTLPFSSARDANIFQIWIFNCDFKIHIIKTFVKYLNYIYNWNMQ